MIAKAVIRAIMESKGIGATKMAALLHFKNVQTVTDRLGTGKSLNISTDKLDEMVRVLGYKVIVVPEEVPLRDGWYEVDDSRNETPTPVPKSADIPEKAQPEKIAKDKKGGSNGR